MDRSALTATGWLGVRLKIAGLVGLGLVFVLQPESFVKLAGGRDQFFGYGLFFAFLVLASLTWRLNETRVEMAELLEALHQLLYGKDYRRDREAIEILLRSLEGSDPSVANTAYQHLVRLTGQNMAQDAKVWRAWWEANKKTFERSRGGAGDRTAP